MQTRIFLAGLAAAGLFSGVFSGNLLPSLSAQGGPTIYHDGWIDLNKNGKKDPYEDPSLPVEKRIDDLLSRMTLEEKTCQLATLYGFGKVLKDKMPNQKWFDRVWKDGIANIDQQFDGRPHTEYDLPASKHARSINEIQRWFIEKTRLGIPVDFTNEGIHGLHARGATCFPQQCGLGATWDTDLIYRIGAVTAREARALGYTNIYAPILDMARDPRWGRVEENYGESPYHSSRLGVAMVKGLQENGVVSTPKHYCVYGIPEGGRDGRARTAPHATPREVFQVYLAPFRAAFTEGGALGTMVSYNDYDGMPVEASTFFLIDLLRRKWGFRGYTVSDSDAVRFIWNKHHVAADYKDAVRLSILGGLNVRTTFTKPEDYILPARELVREGKIPMKTIDERVRDVLRVKYWLGLFDHPYVAHPERSDQVLHCEAHRKLAYRASLESMVLLKNKGCLLPLKKDVKTILVAGPNADAKSWVLGGYGPSGAKMVSVLQGIREKVSKGTEVIYVKGCDIKDKRYPLSEILPEPPKGKDAARIEEARKAAEKADVAILVLGENTSIVGESRSRTSLDLAGYQRELAKAVVSTGTPTVVVLLNGRALSINWIARNVPAILEAWFPGEEGGRAVADVLFGDYNPGGRLAVTFPKTVGQIPYCFPHKPASHSPGRNRVSGALFPFGHGLSYTTFKYSNLKVEPKVQGVGGNIHVSVDVKNTGSRKGDEVVQLYLSDLQASVVPYVKVLRGFRRITLDPGQTRTVRFTLTPDDLRFMGPHMEWIVEPGDFRVQVGPLKAEFTIAP